MSKFRTQAASEKRESRKPQIVFEQIRVKMFFPSKMKKHFFFFLEIGNPREVKDGDVTFGSENKLF
jgi:hypothetical protein